MRLIALLLATVVIAQETAFFVVGDWGSGSNRQRHVAAAMNSVAAIVRPVAILSTGDQLYDFGAKSPDDPIFAARFSGVYGKLHALKDVPWYMSLGNHDCLGNREAVMRHQEPTWKFPSPTHDFARGGAAARGYYAVDFPLARVVVLDTCVLQCVLTPAATRLKHCGSYMRQYGTQDEAAAHAAEQVAWFQHQLAQPHPNATVFVVGHEPAYSTLMYGEQPYLKPLVHVMKKHGVTAYLSGHAHSMQAMTLNATRRKHTREPYVFHQIVSGGGGGYLLSRKPALRAHFNTKYARVESGFVVLFVTASPASGACTWRATFYRVDPKTGHFQESHHVRCDEA